MLVFPVLHSDRIQLRQLTLGDLPDLIHHANNPNISRYILNMPHPYTDVHAGMRLSYVSRGFEDRVRFVFSIVLKETQKLIGEIALHHHDRSTTQWQLAYWLGEEYWGHGLTTKAIKTVLDFARNRLDCSLVYADVSKNNPGSQRVLLKNDFLLHSESQSLQVYQHSFR